jgi:inositol phosphorylceramide mannosyltransferase catalytic subunit
MVAKIPTILHQMWRTAELPRPFAIWRAGWIAQHPHWEHRIYDDAEIRNTITDRSPQWLSTFEALPKAIQRADFFRYLVVFLDGGLYADIDMISYRPCDKLLEGSTCVLGIEIRLDKRSQEALGYSQPWQLANFIFAAAPGHPFLGALLEEIARMATTPIHNDDSVQETTGPRMLTRVANSMLPKHNSSTKILPQINWNPPWILPRIGPFAANIYARHVCFGTWRTESLLRRRFELGLRRLTAAIN